MSGTCSDIPSAIFSYILDRPGLFKVRTYARKSVKSQKICHIKCNKECQWLCQVIECQKEVRSCEYQKECSEYMPDTSKYTARNNVRWSYANQNARKNAEDLPDSQIKCQNLCQHAKKMSENMIELRALRVFTPDLNRRSPRNHPARTGGSTDQHRREDGRGILVGHLWTVPKSTTSITCP